MKKSIIAFLTILMLFGCQSNSNDDENPTDLSFHNTSWHTSIDAFEAVGFHKDGSLLAIDYTPGTDYFGKVLFQRDQATPPFIIWADSSGMPKLSYWDGNFWIYENWTSTTVDLGIIWSNGETQIIKGLELPNTVPTLVGNNFCASDSVALAGPSLATIMRWAGHAAGVAACVLTAPSALTPAAVLWGVGCTVTIVKIANEILDNEDTAARASDAALGSFLSAFNCINRTVASCVSFVTNLAAAVTTAAENDKIAKSSIIESTRNEMNAVALFTENFESSTVGSTPTGWTVEHSGQTIQVSDTEHYEGSKSVFMQGQPWWGANLIKSVSSLNIVSGEYRFGFRVYIDATNWTGTDGSVAGHLEAAGKVCGMGVSKVNGAYTTYMYSTNSAKPAFTGTLNAWNLCEMVIDYDANTVKFYLNGAQVGTDTLGASSYVRVNMGAGDSGPGGGHAACYYDVITIRKTR